MIECHTEITQEPDSGVHGVKYVSACTGGTGPWKAGCFGVVGLAATSFRSLI